MCGQTPQIIHRSVRRETLSSQGFAPVPVETADADLESNPTGSASGLLAKLINNFCETGAESERRRGIGGVLAFLRVSAALDRSGRARRAALSR